jgi:DNA-binding NarL/FixJ family response regulator
MIRVLLADDQPLLLQGFALILSTEDDIEVVGTARDGHEAVAAVQELAPDVVLMDVQMPGLDGIEATREVVRRSEAAVVMLTTFDRDDYLFDALQAGASGFMLKNADPEDLVDAVRVAAQGHGLLAPEVTRRVIEATVAAPGPGERVEKAPAGGTGAPRPAHDTRLAALTSREREVLVLVARGLSNAEIAQQLWLGEATVKTHVSSILAKLGLRDRVQAVVLAYETGLAGTGS